MEAGDESTWQIEIDHDAYYRWVPVKLEDVTDEMLTVDATWPGFKLQRVIIPEATTSTTGVHVESLAKENEDRAAAGLGPKPLHTLLANHLEDGPWPKHFPMESITAIRCSDPKIEAKLQSYFLDEVSE